jgi:hypothetical protein
LLAEFGVNHPKAASLWCDNLGTTYLSGNTMFHARTNLMDVEYHFIQERAANM